jgi:hypothetical protein
MSRLDPRSLLPASLLVLWSAGAFAVDPQDTLLLAQPDISERHITFVYDGDVWVANRDGSGAYRLTTAEGQESQPHFSPDGTPLLSAVTTTATSMSTWLPIAGGSPKRLTWHSADDLVEGFDPRGRIVFSSQSDVQTARDVHLFTIDPQAAFPERLPISEGRRCRRLAGRPCYRLCADGSAGAMEKLSRRHGVAHRDHELRGPRVDASSAAALARQRHRTRCGSAASSTSTPTCQGEFNLHLVRSGDRRGAAADVVPGLPGGQRQRRRRQDHLRASRPSARVRPATSNTTTLRVAVASDLRETRPRRASNVDYVRNVSPAPDLEQVALE